MGQLHLTYIIIQVINRSNLSLLCAGPLQPLDLQILNLGQISAHGIGVRLELPALTALLQHVPSAISSEAAAKLQQVATAAAGQHVQVGDVLRVVATTASVIM